MSFNEVQIGCQKESKFDFQNQFYSLLIHFIKSPPLRSRYCIWRKERKCDVSPFSVDFSIGLRKDIGTHSSVPHYSNAVSSDVFHPEEVCM